MIQSKRKREKRRGSFSGLRKSTEDKFKWGNVEAIGESRVEVAPLAALLQSWAPLNRAYGWGVTLDVLTNMGGSIGGQFGNIEIEGVPDIKGCLWVRLEEALTEFPSADIVMSSLASPCHLLVLVPLMCLRRAGRRPT